MTLLRGSIKIIICDVCMTSSWRLVTYIVIKYDHLGTFVAQLTSPTKNHLKFYITWAGSSLPLLLYTWAVSDLWSRTTCWNSGEEDSETVHFPYVCDFYFKKLFQMCLLEHWFIKSSIANFAYESARTNDLNEANYWPTTVKLSNIIFEWNSRKLITTYSRHIEFVIFNL